MNALKKSIFALLLGLAEVSFCLDTKFEILNEEARNHSNLLINISISAEQVGFNFKEQNTIKNAVLLFVIKNKAGVTSKKYNDVATFVLADVSTLLSQRNKDGETAIHRAVLSDNIDMVKALVDAAIQVDPEMLKVRDRFDSTILHRAQIPGKIAMADYLMTAVPDLRNIPLRHRL